MRHKPKPSMIKIPSIFHPELTKFLEKNKRKTDFTMYPSHFSFPSNFNKE